MVNIEKTFKKRWVKSPCITIFNGTIHYFYGKSPFLMGKSMENPLLMVIFNSYVKLPEGKASVPNGSALKHLPSRLLRLGVQRHLATALLGHVRLFRILLILARKERPIDTLW
jgi:hypothetical protein